MFESLSFLFDCVKREGTAVLFFVLPLMRFATTSNLSSTDIVSEQLIWAKFILHPFLPQNHHFLFMLILSYKDNVFKDIWLVFFFLFSVLAKVNKCNWGSVLDLGITSTLTPQKIILSCLDKGLAGFILIHIGIKQKSILVTVEIHPGHHRPLWTGPAGKELKASNLAFKHHRSQFNRAPMENAGQTNLIHGSLSCTQNIQRIHLGSFVLNIFLKPLRFDWDHSLANCKLYERY